MLKIKTRVNLDFHYTNCNIQFPYLPSRTGKWSAETLRSILNEFHFILTNGFVELKIVEVNIVEGNLLYLGSVGFCIYMYFPNFADEKAKNLPISWNNFFRPSLAKF